MRLVEEPLTTRVEGQRILSYEKVKFELNVERIRSNQVKTG